MREGDVLADRYEIGPLLGLGGSGAVHRAWDRIARMPVAVKLFTSTSAGHEVAVLAALDHPGIVSLLGTGTTGGLPFAVLQFVDGPSLYEELRSAPLAPSEVMVLGARLADALTHVHAVGAVHCDVKPGNILLDRERCPLLADFGLARLLDAARVTVTGDLVGTVAYMAPEQVLGGVVGAPADVYSLGLVLLEAVTGRREYSGGLIESALARLQRDPEVPATVPEPLAGVLMEMTAPEPAWRPSAAAVAAALWRAGDRVAQAA